MKRHGTSETRHKQTLRLSQIADVQPDGPRDRYAENAEVGNGHLDHGMEVITTPFAMTAPTCKIEEMLDRPQA